MITPGKGKSYDVVVVKGGADRIAMLEGNNFHAVLSHMGCLARARRLGTIYGQRHRRHGLGCMLQSFSKRVEFYRECAVVLAR